MRSSQSLHPSSKKPRHRIYQFCYRSECFRTPCLHQYVYRIFCRVPVIFKLVLLVGTSFDQVRIYLAYGHSRVRQHADSFSTGWSYICTEGWSLNSVFRRNGKKFFENRNLDHKGLSLPSKHWPRYYCDINQRNMSFERSSAEMINVTRVPLISKNWQSLSAYGLCKIKFTLSLFINTPYYELYG